MQLSDVPFVELHPGGETDLLTFLRATFGSEQPKVNLFLTRWINCPECPPWRLEVGIERIGLYPPYTKRILCVGFCVYRSDIDPFNRSYSAIIPLGNYPDEEQVKRIASELQPGVEPKDVRGVAVWEGEL